ncbi:MAG: ATP-binding protein [Acetobacteraceae bacterium]
MRLRVWPRSLATRTAVVLLLGLALVQSAGLVIHGLDRIDLQRLAQARDVAERVVGVYRTIAATAPSQREVVAANFRRGPGVHVELSATPPAGASHEIRTDIGRLVRVRMDLVPLGMPNIRWRDALLYATPHFNHLLVAFHLPDGMWLHVTVPVQPVAPWHSPLFLISFVVMTVLAAMLTVWAVRRLTKPVRTLAAAAEALGRDVNAPPLPEDGPSEVATAARAFNTMAGRVRRFVADRTELLTAIGHDLRTPITRLQLRAEFMEDADQRARMLSDLADLEAMVSATLAFGRDASASEPAVALDLAALLQTILDEAKDAWPAAEQGLVYDGPAHLTIRGRSLSLKRALTNLVTNAVKYGGSARVRLLTPANGMVQVEIEDAGPGIRPEELERVFEPFHRGESSRNRETGGVGLGLPIARNILRSHGGDIVLANRTGGGLKATVTLAV